MSLPLSREVEAVYRRADELAGVPQKEMSTGHVLLALFEVPNRAAKLLRDRSVTPEAIAQGLRNLDVESPQLMMRVRRRSRRLAKGSRSAPLRPWRPKPCGPPDRRPGQRRAPADRRVEFDLALFASRAPQYRQHRLSPLARHRGPLERRGLFAVRTSAVDC